MKSLIPTEGLEQRIYLIRGHKVMLDSDLAVLYDVPTFRLNEQVKRNRQRFPQDFMFRLTPQEFLHLKSHFCDIKPGMGRPQDIAPGIYSRGRSDALRGPQQSPSHPSQRPIMRVFVKLREVLATHEDLAKQLESIEILGRARPHRSGSHPARQRARKHV